MLFNDWIPACFDPDGLGAAEMTGVTGIQKNKGNTARSSGFGENDGAGRRR